MGTKNRYQPFEERFLRLSIKVESLLKKILLLFIAILIIVQLLLSFDFFRKTFIPIEKMEGSIQFKIDFPT
ncbi:hypothetical protein [Tepidibacillus sp. LV47]|uniref:hypothetical protein n=1 Tax=Tepidibacillus sp. LV47 TaxID=3398228 RepID=UPI003AB0E588